MSETSSDTSIDDGGTYVLRNRDIVCFSNDWNGDPYSKTHLMRRLAVENRILWIDSVGYRSPLLSKRDLRRLFVKLRAAITHITNPEPNIFVLSPFAFPIYTGAFWRFLNSLLLRCQIRRAMRSLGFRDPISWFFLPTAGVVAGKLGERLVIYHCVDDFTGFKGVSPQAIADMEQQLISRSDLVIVSAQSLCSSKAMQHDRVVLVRHGVEHGLFARALAPETQIPCSIRSLPRPILGFFGLISDDWIDFDLLSYVADQFPSGSLVLLGSVTSNVGRLNCKANVHMLGRVPYNDLAAYCKGFDVALIPFVQSNLTEHCNPLKMWQYLAAGLPVVSTPIPEVCCLPECRIAGDKESFVSQIEAALQDPGPTAHRSNLMKHHSWDNRVKEIVQHIVPLLHEDMRVPEG
jgi:glycosyltransferase involved in cell wall biosynthesis